MKKTALRRLEALEMEERSREQKELSSLAQARLYIWIIVLAYYLGGLESDEEDFPEAGKGPWEAYARALKYASSDDYFEALKKDLSEIHERHNDAYRRLFANVGLDFDDASPGALFDAVVTMVKQLPEQWLNWLRSKLQRWYSGAEIAAGSNLPRRLSGDNLFIVSRNEKLSRKSRVFTQAPPDR